jgi:hypothetical protein
LLGRLLRQRRHGERGGGGVHVGERKVPGRGAGHRAESVGDLGQRLDGGQALQVVGHERLCVERVVLRREREHRRRRRLLSERKAAARRRRRREQHVSFVHKVQVVRRLRRRRRLLLLLLHERQFERVGRHRQLLLVVQVLLRVVGAQRRLGDVEQRRGADGQRQRRRLLLVVLMTAVGVRRDALLLAPLRPSVLEPYLQENRFVHVTMFAPLSQYFRIMNIEFCFIQHSRLLHFRNFVLYLAHSFDSGIVTDSNYKFSQGSDSMQSEFELWRWGRE